MGRTLAPQGGGTVVIIDDHQVFAELLGEMLTARGLTVLAVHGSLADGVADVARAAPDLVILDHLLPGATGASGVRALKMRSPSTRVLMLTAADEQAVLLEAMNAGCDGFVTKRQDIGEVLAAVAAVLRGDTPVSPDMVGALLARRPGSLGADLTAREVEVLHEIGAGRSNKQVARELGISVNTVRNHVQHILTKLGAHSQLEAVAIAAGLGLLGSGRGGGGAGDHPGVGGA